MVNSGSEANLQGLSTNDARVLAVCGKEEFSRESKVMELFINNAETYTKLSSAALFLTVTFLRQVMGLSTDAQVPRSPLLMISWICFLVAILAGVSYQYLAVKYLEWRSGVPRTHKNPYEWLVQHPWRPYGIMLGSFYLGAVFFTGLPSQGY
jgi:hypothetical protein